MTGFELRTSDIGSDRSTNWATTTALRHNLVYFQISFHLHTLMINGSMSQSNQLNYESVVMGLETRADGDEAWL